MRWPPSDGRFRSASDFLRLSPARALFRANALLAFRAAAGLLCEISNLKCEIVPEINTPHPALRFSLKRLPSEVLSTKEEVLPARNKCFRRRRVTKEDQ